MEPEKCPTCGSDDPRCVLWTLGRGWACPDPWHSRAEVPAAPDTPLPSKSKRLARSERALTAIQAHGDLTENESSMKWTARVALAPSAIDHAPEALRDVIRERVLGAEETGVSEGGPARGVSDSAHPLADPVSPREREGEGVTLWRAPHAGWTDWRQISDQDEEYLVACSPGAESRTFYPAAPPDTREREYRRAVLFQWHKAAADTRELREAVKAEAARLRERGQRLNAAIEENEGGDPVGVLLLWLNESADLLDAALARAEEKGDG